MNSSIIPPSPDTQVQVSPVVAPAILLIGGPGSGKTDSLGSLLEYFADVFVLGTETRFKDSLLDSVVRRGLDKSRLHTRLVQPLPGSFSSLIASATLINTLSYESLCAIKNDPSKSSYGQFIELLRCLSDFVDDTGKHWGPVDSWGADRALCIDSLSGLNLMALDLVVGTKPVKAMGEWGVAMDNLERLINTLTSSVKCMFVLTAHVDRETDEITGGTTLQVGALGKKMAPKLPRFFSEVVHARREGDKYYWSTITPNYELKRRVLPFGDKIEPSFKPIVEAWRKR